MPPAVRNLLKMGSWALALWLFFAVLTPRLVALSPAWQHYDAVQEQYGLDRDELLQKLSEQKIQTRPIWGLIHQQKPYQNNQAFKIEKASYYMDRILNIPCSTNLTEEDARYVSRALESLQ